jgi:hypothetical protein
MEIKFMLLENVKERRDQLRFVSRVLSEEGKAL